MTKNTTMKKVEIEIPEGKKAEWINGVLTLVDDTPKDIKERVKTFEDALTILGNDNQTVIDYFTIYVAGCSKDILAFAKLRVIAAALNEGWEPTFDEYEPRYYPWFNTYNKENYEKLDEDKKKECCVPLRSTSNALAVGGLVFAHAGNAGLSSVSGRGVRLVLKTKELAEYCGKQFIDIWTDFLFA